MNNKLRMGHVRIDEDYLFLYDNSEVTCDCMWIPTQKQISVNKVIVQTDCCDATYIIQFLSLLISTKNMFLMVEWDVWDGVRWKNCRLQFNASE